MIITLCKEKARLTATVDFPKYLLYLINFTNYMYQFTCYYVFCSYISGIYPGSLKWVKNSIQY